MNWSGGVADCDDQANLMVHAIGILGIDGTVNVIYPSAASPDPFSKETRWHMHGGKGIKETLIADCSGAWNNFEGYLTAPGGCYAVWPAMKETNPCDILTNFIGGCAQKWVDYRNRVIHHPGGAVNCSAPACQ